MLFDVRLKGATVLATDSAFEAQVKLQELVEQGYGDKLSVYYKGSEVSWSWRAEVRIDYW